MEDLKFKKIEAGVVDACPECGCENLIEVHFCLAGKRENERRYRNGLKCYDCGVILAPKDL